MAFEKLEEIIGWQKAQMFACELYQVFGNLKDFTFRNQILGASISISNNIAEGFDRQSNKEFVRFLYYALGSFSETKSMIYLSLKLGYCDPPKNESLIEKANEISRIIHGLINSMNKNKSK